MKKRKGLIFVISAPSGSGKTTICKRVLKRVKGLLPSVSVTTRPRRKGEKDKKDYFYVTHKVFKEKVKKNDFLEWEENFGYLYGTPKKFVLDKVKRGEDVLLSIDVKGACKIRKKLPESIFIFIKPPSIKELMKRLKIRDTDNDEEIAKRLKIARKEIDYKDEYDYVVINRKLEDAVKKVVAIIRKERGV